MQVGLDSVSKLVVTSGYIVLDGTMYTGEVDCRRMSGIHDLELFGAYDFRSMTSRDYADIQTENSATAKAQINELTLEIVQKDYQILTGEEL